MFHNIKKVFRKSYWKLPIHMYLKYIEFFELYFVLYNIHKTCVLIWLTYLWWVCLTSINIQTFKKPCHLCSRNHSLQLTTTRGWQPLWARNQWLLIVTSDREPQPWVVANMNEWLRTTSVCEDHSWQGFSKVGICNDVEKRKVPLSFCILALSFKLYLYNCEADPLKLLINQ